MRLSEALPNFASSIAAALESEGFAHLRTRVLSAEIERWTYDPRALAGYIYVKQRTQIHADETPAAQTLAFGDPYWFNVDLRRDGDIFGIELLENAEHVTSALNAYRAP